MTQKADLHPKPNVPFRWYRSQLVLVLAAFGLVVLVILPSVLVLLDVAKIHLFVLLALGQLLLMSGLLSLIAGKLRSEVRSARGKADERTAMLKACQKEYHILFESSPAMVWFKDGHNRILRCNEKAANSSGMAAREMEGHLTSEFHPVEAERYYADDLEVMRSKEPRLGIVEPLTTKTGLTLWVQTDKIPYVNDAGEVDGIVVFSTDVTPLKLAEEENATLLRREQEARKEAEAANRLKDEFLMTLSHELRTPLTPILGWIHRLRIGGLSTEEAQHALATIERNAEAQRHLVDDLLDVSRIISGKMALALSLVPINAMLRSGLESFRPAAEAKGVSLALVSDLPEEASIFIDRERFGQVIWNLLANGVKFTQLNGSVVVTPHLEGSRFRLDVADTGIGIPSDVLPHVFERFRQGDASLTRPYMGLGLGLAIVRHLVELHGGSVWAESPGRGKGATFTVELPQRGSK